MVLEMLRAQGKAWSETPGQDKRLWAMSPGHGSRDLVCSLLGLILCVLCRVPEWLVAVRTSAQDLWY